MNSNDLTHSKASNTYGRLVQVIDNNFYDGYGNPIIKLTSKLLKKSGEVPGTLFNGYPQKYLVIFDDPFTSNNYSISIISNDSRIWTYEDKNNTQFTMNSNSNTALTNPVSWIAIEYGEEF